MNEKNGTVTNKQCSAISVVPISLQLCGSQKRAKNVIFRRRINGETKFNLNKSTFLRYELKCRTRSYQKQG